MAAAIGPEIDDESAVVHLAQVGLRLRDGEELRYLGGAARLTGHDLHVVTSERILMVSSKRDYEIRNSIQVRDVVRASTADTGGDLIVHVFLTDDDVSVLWPHPTTESAGALAREIHAAAAAKHRPADEPLMPEEVPGAAGLDRLGVDYLQVVVAHADVLAGDIAPTLRKLAPLLQSRRTARAFMERVAIYVSGYDDVTWELFEIDEVRDFVHALDQRFPYWLFFLDKRTGSFDAIWRSLMPPFLTPEAQMRIFPTHLEPLLRNWWTPAMDKIADFAGLTAAEHYALCERYADYFQGRRDF